MGSFKIKILSSLGSSTISSSKGAHLQITRTENVGCGLMNTMQVQSPGPNKRGYKPMDEESREVIPQARHITIASILWTTSSQVLLTRNGLI